MPNHNSDQSRPGVHRPLPVTITSGMPVVSLDDSPPGRIVGITRSYCIYRAAGMDSVTVAPWREVALGNVCPAHALLPSDIGENDRLNASATVLRELSELKRVAKLSASQSAAYQELLDVLCGHDRQT